MKNILLVLFLIFASFAFGQSYHTIIMNDTTIAEWNENEKYQSTDPDSKWGMTWDENYIYFLYENISENSSNGSYSLVYIDTDPQLDPLTGNGSSAANWSYDSGGNITLSFNADYEIGFTSGRKFARHFTTSWNDVNIGTRQDVGNDVEYRLSRADLGNPSSIYVTMFRCYNSPVYDHGFAFAPTTNRTGTDVTHYEDINGIANWSYFLEANLGAAVTPFQVTDTPLPVELKSFSASVDGKNVNLAWQTATEVNNYGFEVERLTVNGKWEKLGFVAGKGNTNAAQNYTFADNNVSGKVSYRLKQIDIDGKFEYSEVVAAEVIANEFVLEQNFPNPFNPSTVINYSLAKEAFVKLAVYNAIGQEVVTLVNGVQPVGAHKVTFNASSFNSGVYFYRIETADFTAMRKMLLVK